MDAWSAQGSQGLTPCKALPRSNPHRPRQRGSWTDRKDTHRPWGLEGTNLRLVSCCHSDLGHVTSLLRPLSPGSWASAVSPRGSLWGRHIAFVKHEPSAQPMVGAYSGPGVELM